MKGVKDMERDMVSIITPSYNSKEFIGNAIQSVKDQTYGNFEMIIIDDGSKDNSVLAIKSLINNDKRIKLISLSENVGAAEARNIGIVKARGRFIAFLDSDDIWYPGKLKKQVDFMKKNNIAFSFTSYEMITEVGEKTHNIVRAPKKVDYHGLLKNTIIGCLTVMLDTNKIGKIKMPNCKPEDTALWLKLLKEDLIAYGMPQVLAQYRLVDGSVSSNKIKAAQHLWNLYRKQENLPFPKSLWYFSHYALNAIKKHKF
ncbi:glycosyl transferase [Bacillus sp. AFS043905]|nr:glycosyl transferase [Bacillus sp. AFS043905]